MIYIIMFFVLFFGIPSLIVFIISTIKGESTTAKVSKERKIQKSIKNKAETKEDLSDEEKQYIAVKTKNIIIFNDLNMKNQLAQRSNDIRDFSTEDIYNKLKKIVWFYCSIDSYDYYVVYGKRANLRLDTDDLIILHHLLNLFIFEKGIDVTKYLSIENFMRDVGRAFNWASSNKDSWLFKRKPTQLEEKTFHEFNNAMFGYEQKVVEGDCLEEYVKMKNAFYEFFDAIE